MIRAAEDRTAQSIQRVMTGLCKHRHIVTHFDQSQIDQRA
jgi:hypothetical protein